MITQKHSGFPPKPQTQSHTLPRHSSSDAVEAGLETVEQDIKGKSTETVGELGCCTAGGTGGCTGGCWRLHGRASDLALPNSSIFGTVVVVACPRHPAASAVAPSSRGADAGDAWNMSNMMVGLFCAFLWPCLRSSLSGFQLSQFGRCCSVDRG
jgi:hypothetical protein